MSFLLPKCHIEKEFRYDPSKYSRYDLYKGVNIMLRDDEDLGYLTFGNFFKEKGAEISNKVMPPNIVLIGSAWIPVPKYSYDKKRIRLSELDDYHSSAVRKMVDTYLSRDLILCLELGVIKSEMDQRLFQFYKDSDRYSLRNFIDISTITREERKILRSVYNHPWTYQERGDFDGDDPSVLEDIVDGLGDRIWNSIQDKKES